MHTLFMQPCKSTGTPHHRLVVTGSQSRSIVPHVAADTEAAPEAAPRPAPPTSQGGSMLPVGVAFSVESSIAGRHRRVASSHRWQPLASRVGHLNSRTLQAPPHHSKQFATRAAHNTRACCSTQSDPVYGLVRVSEYEQPQQTEVNCSRVCSYKQKEE